MIAVNEARTILEQEAPAGTIVEVKLTASCGLLLAKDVFAQVSVPPFDNSAMDGYAVQLDGQRNVWKLNGEIPAGTASLSPLQKGTAIRIFTGSPVPEGANAVIQQEIVELVDNKLVCSDASLKPGMNIRTSGSQIRQGELVLTAGKKITPGAIGLLASCGIDRVAVYKAPSVGVIITGSELTETGTALEPGKIYNSNAPMLETSLRQLGIDQITLGHTTDKFETTRELIHQFVEQHDLVVISGGISVGDYDFVKTALESLEAHTLMYKIKQRPGKPFYAGLCRNKMIFALPGNPASVLSCFTHYVKPVLKKMMGYVQVWQPDAWAPITSGCDNKSGFTFFLKGNWHKGKVDVLPGQQSFNLMAFADANCFIELPEDANSVSEGTLVPVYFLYQ